MHYRLFLVRSTRLFGENHYALRCEPNSTDRAFECTDEILIRYFGFVLFVSCFAHSLQKTSNRRVRQNRHHNFFSFLSSFLPFSSLHFSIFPLGKLTSNPHLSQEFLPSSIAITTSFLPLVVQGSTAETDALISVPNNRLVAGASFLRVPDGSGG